ncbi:MAG: hypothetical protein V4516_07100 [Pseudomonadota bacterium]
MTGANKILTVSYGTFSCTLEGFDDPFTTMKAIAEYFRDLAADDRYFGAEPPTPDAAMLHRIAEREVQRRVEAKISENGVTLRTGDAVEPVGAPAPATVPPQPVAPSLDAARDPAAEDSVAARLLRLRRATAETDAAPSATVLATTVAWAAAEAGDLYEDEHFDTVETVSLAEETTADMQAPLTVDLSPDLPDAELADEPAQTAAEVLAEAAAAVDPVAPTVDAEPAQPSPEREPADAGPRVVNGALGDHDDVTNIFADTFDPVDVIDHVATPPAAAESAADEGVVAAADAELAEIDVIEASGNASAAEAVADDADLLQRLVLGREDSPRVNLDDTAPPESADAGALSDMIATLSGAETAPDAPELAEAQYDDGAADLSAGDDLYFEDRLPESDPPTIPDLVEDMVSNDAPDAADLTDLSAEREAYFAASVAEMDDNDADPTGSRDFSDLSEDLAPKATAPLSAKAPSNLVNRDDASELIADDDETDDTSAGLLSKAQMARARVIKIRRPGTTERPTMLGDAGLMPQPAEVPAAALSEAAEAELAAELAAADGTTDAPDGDKDADVARLMRQADTEMAGPENRRRLSAIAHLKAAVAATIADRRVGRGKTPAPEDQRIDPYRDDLARVVRPLQGGDAPPPLPVPERAAPLVLVSEQRIDRPRVTSTAPISAVGAAPVPAGPVMPVRPRRVVAGSGATAMAEPVADTVATADAEDDDDRFDDAAIFADPRSFSEFAERLGAEDLPSLLQAAAAYAMEVEEMPSFTRPQLLRQIEAHGEPGDFQREDVLRSFGQLLRTGDFIKKRRGQYALQDGAAILADARKIAGQI